MPRPILYVLAGVNGAGKSSIGGHLLREAGLDWFNPDTFARKHMAETGSDQTTANGIAWAEGMRRLDAALSSRRHYALETTLGGDTVAQKILKATRSHDVLMWFCGLDSPEHHIARVRARVTSGGHDIPEARIRERYPRAQLNLIALMPLLVHLQVWDNSADVAPGEAVPDPVLVLEMENGRLVRPSVDDPFGVAQTPDWGKALVEAAIHISSPLTRNIATPRKS